MSGLPEFAVFVKPWKELALPQLALHVLQLGFKLIELPIRPGFPVEPARIEQDLPAAVKLLGDLGIGVVNVTAALPLDDERLYAACAAGGIRMNRVIFKRVHPSYWESEAAAAPPTRRGAAPVRALWSADWRAASLWRVGADQQHGALSLWSKSMTHAMWGQSGMWRTMPCKAKTRRRAWNWCSRICAGSI